MVSVYITRLIIGFPSMLRTYICNIQKYIGKPTSPPVLGTCLLGATRDSCAAVRVSPCLRACVSHSSLQSTSDTSPIPTTRGCFRAADATLRSPYHSPLPSALDHMESSEQRVTGHVLPAKGLLVVGAREVASASYGTTVHELSQGRQLCLDIFFSYM